MPIMHRVQTIEQDLIDALQYYARGKHVYESDICGAKLNIARDDSETVAKKALQHYYTAINNGLSALEASVLDWCWASCHFDDDGYYHPYDQDHLAACVALTDKGFMTQSSSVIGQRFYLTAPGVDLGKRLHDLKT